MAVTKIKWANFGGALEGYTKKDRGEELLMSSVNMNQEEFAEQLYAEKKFFHDESKVIALHVMQSWGKDESTLLPKERYNEMGEELAKRLAPGHTAWVVTHLDRAHLHNHICISMIHSETGKRLEQNQAMIYKVRQVSDDLCKENGLSVIQETLAKREQKLPQKAKDALARGRRSYLYDLQQKAEIARSAVTTFDEYVQAMDALGVKVRVEDKNIRYFYGERTKPIRGRNLGTRYARDGLIEAFKKNDERYANNPGSRKRMFERVAASHDGKGNLLPQAEGILSEAGFRTNLLNKDYGKFTPIARHYDQKPLPAGFQGHSILEQELRHANSKSIREYCYRNGIALSKNQNGQDVLRGKEFVVFESDNRLRNTKNQTYLGLVDFVSIHQDISHLQAAAKINGNSRLLLLENVVGETNRRFKSFYLPKLKSADRRVAKSALARLLSSNGYPSKNADKLLGAKGLTVDRSGSVWFVNEAKDSAAEFSERPDGEWKTKRHGNPRGLFHESVRRSNKVVVYSNPLDFLASHQGMRQHRDASVLALFDETAVDSHIREFLVKNRHVNQVWMGSRINFDHMKKHLDPFSIEIKPLEPIGIEMGRGRGPDIGF